MLVKTSENNNSTSRAQVDKLVFMDLDLTYLLQITAITK